MYAAEITTETGVSIASAMVWVLCILIGLFTTSLFDALKPHRVYFLFAFICVISTFIIVVFIKETKGLSKKDLKRLYAPEMYAEFDEQQFEDEKIPEKQLK